jgi:hypothetical protein
LNQGKGVSLVWSIYFGALSRIAPHGPGWLGPVAPATIFITFGERDAIMTAGYATPKYRRDEVESTYDLSFGVT